MRFVPNLRLRSWFSRSRGAQAQLSIQRRLVVGAAAGLLLWLFQMGPLGRRIENVGYDLLFLLRGPQAVPEEIVIVAIDDRSFVDLKRQWPWPRSIHAKLIDRLAKAEAKIIGFDIIFDQPSIAAEDAALAKALAQAGNVVLAADLPLVETVSARQTIYIAPLPALEKTAAGVGIVNLLLEPDGVIRRAQVTRGKYPTFAAVIARAAGWNGQGMAQNYLVNYLGPAPAFTTVSYSQALDEAQIPNQFFKQKIVLIGRSGGASGRPVEDSHFIPFSKGGRRAPGVEIHAAMLDTLMHQRPIQPVAPLLRFTWFITWGMLASLLLGKLSLWSGFAVLLALIAVDLTFSLTAFSDSNLWIPWATPALGMTAVYIGMVGLRWQKAEQEKKFIRGAFQRYLHPKIIEEIVDDPSKLRLGGESVESTILFSDLEGFTRVAEGFTPSDLVSFLNEYFAAMTDVILKQGGMLNRTLGDGILALWGVPIKDPDHALKACRAALAMQQRLSELNIGWRARQLPPLRMRIGIQTGEIVVGNIGSEQHFDYTPIGDNVNLASRLEGVNKLYKTNLIIGEESARRVAEVLELRELDRIRVVGRVEPVSISECLGERGTLPEERREAYDKFHRGLQLYRSQEWGKALEYFEQVLAILPGDGPSKLYIERCRHFSVEPPPAKWDGVYTALGKEG